MHDILLEGISSALLQRHKRLLVARFAITGLGNAYLVLGMKITWDREAGSLKVRQADYVKYLDRCIMRDFIQVATPIYEPELSTTQPLEALLDGKGIREYQ